MASQESVEKQLEKINFNWHAWGRAEVGELPNIILDNEEIYEAVNGIYEGGFALLLATNVRMLLIDKKPLNFLTVEDFRFDMINELDYSHRLIGARINVATGNKTLNFFSFNQKRLRKAIGHIQHCMAASKHQQSEHAEDQKHHLAQINQQLQAYLLAQHQQQENLRRQLEEVAAGQKKSVDVEVESVKPSPELSDYLLAQRLLQQAKEKEKEGGGAENKADKASVDEPEKSESSALPPAPRPEPSPASPQMADLYAEGMKEIFGRRPPSAQSQSLVANDVKPPADNKRAHLPKPFDANPLHIACAKLPLALRNKKFGRPSFHAHSQADA